MFHRNVVQPAPAGLREDKPIANTGPQAITESDQDALPAIGFGTRYLHQLFHRSTILPASCRMRLFILAIFRCRAYDAVWKIRIAVCPAGSWYFAGTDSAPYRRIRHGLHRLHFAGLFAAKNLSSNRI